MRREKKILHPFFFAAPSPGETVLGESPVSGRRMELDDDLRNGSLPLWEKGE